MAPTCKLAEEKVKIEVNIIHCSDSEEVTRINMSPADLNLGIETNIHKKMKCKDIKDREQS